MQKRLTALALATSFALSSAALAAAPTTLGPSPAAPTKKEAGPRRDKAGVTGISPFWEALNKGDSAYVARDFDAAIAAYRDAIAKDPQNALGHYRMGEAQLAKADLHEAEEAFVSGLRFVGQNAALKAKLEFAIADLRERQKAYDDATQKWNDYEKTSTEEKEAAGYPATASERKKVIEAWKALSVDAAAVKGRIEKRLKEADDAVRKSSK